MTSEKKAAEILSDFMEADKGLVESFNNAFSLQGYLPIEARLSFVETRLTQTGSALATIIKKLIEERAP